MEIIDEVLVALRRLIRAFEAFEQNSRADCAPAIAATDCQA